MFDGYCPNSKTLDENIRIVEEMCPAILKIPSVPDLFGDIHFVDGIWQCMNGLDELGCDLLLPLNCSSNQHICMSSYTNKLICLSIEKTNDGIIDCLGGIDEPKVCRRKNPLDQLNDFRCLNDSSKSCIASTNICNSSKACLHGDDKQFCTVDNITAEDNCQESFTLDSFDINQFIYKNLEVRRFSRRTILSLND